MIHAPFGGRRGLIKRLAINRGEVYYWSRLKLKFLLFCTRNQKITQLQYGQYKDNFGAGEVIVSTKSKNVNDFIFCWKIIHFSSDMSTYRCLDGPSFQHGRNNGLSKYRDAPIQQFGTRSVRYTIRSICIRRKKSVSYSRGRAGWVTLRGHLIPR